MVGVDLGGTKIFAASVVDGRVVATAKRSTPRAGGPDAILDRVVDAIGRLGLDGPLGCVAIGGPGPADQLAGTIGPAANLTGWDRPVDVRTALRARLTGVEVLVDNDVNAAARAEARHGVGRTHRDFAAFYVGTGVGGAVVLDGRVRRGMHGLAGEVGHLTVVADGEPCGCGGRGHLEAYAGRAGIERRARAAHAAGRATRLIDLAGDGRMKSSIIAAALSDGDDLAHELVADAASALGTAVAAVGVLVDVSAVAVGGGLGERLGNSFLADVASAARDRTPWPASVHVLPAETGDAAGALGAALLAEDV